MIKINRSYPAPVSLACESQKVAGNYSKTDVIERLKNDFHDKCYICEMKELQDPQVEHLHPHKNGRFPERKYDWDNLFWACGHCNNVKNRQIYDEGILDCCKRDPEEAIAFNMVENDVDVRALDPQDQEAVLTAKLVQEVFNIRNTGMRVIKSDLRLKKLQEEMNVLYTQLEAYKHQPESSINKRTLKALLKRESAFAGFKRRYIRDRLDEYPELELYIV